MASSAVNRPYDVVFYGANGYTGALTAAYLAKQQRSAGADGRYATLRWAIAGRSKAKLEALAASLAEKRQSGASSTIPIIVASTDDAASLDAMCAQTRVLVSFAGPYLRCGLPVVAACVRGGAHYVDITGEMPFIRSLVDSIHDDAKAKGVAIVNSCGFDCVPSDMGSFMVHQHVEELNNRNTNNNNNNAADADATPKRIGPITAMEGFFTLIGDLAPSGGTAATLSNTFLAGTPEDENPLSINPPQYRSRISAPIRKGMRWTPSIGKYSGPFLMACENERIVRRSNCLLGRPRVAYSEAVAGSIGAVFMEFLQFWAINILLPISFLNAIVLFFLPKPGAGPTEKEKEGSKYQATFVATTEGGQRFKGEWYDERNAYDTTAVFVVEIAHMLSGAAPEGAGIQQFGVVTPASALGQPLLDNLVKHCGIRTEVFEVTQNDKRK